MNYLRSRSVQAALVVAIALLIAAAGACYLAPKLAWRYGTPEMQRYAAQVLIHRIQPGMTYAEVVEILGKGSSEWPALKERKLGPEETVSFNVRSWYNNGVDVYFRNGKVISTSYYD